MVKGIGGDRNRDPGADRFAASLHDKKGASEKSGEAAQKCTMIGNEMVPMWYPDQNGTSSKSAGIFYNLLLYRDYISHNI